MFKPSTRRLSQSLSFAYISQPNCLRRITHSLIGAKQQPLRAHLRHDEFQDMRRHGWQDHFQVDVRVFPDRLYRCPGLRI
ncbi:MAG: hypothetical protein PHW60_13870 [Kiritimatiellae bacterium]|nr:hypothetical protein [Kiritimatiellia bacterium]